MLEDRAIRKGRIPSSLRLWDYIDWEYQYVGDLNIRPHPWRATRSLRD